MEKLIILIMCHLVGDYVLQSDFIAKTKGENWYHLFVHCALYTLPFGVVYGFVWQTIFHIFIDVLKARYKKITYTTDQILHYVVACSYFI